MSTLIERIDELRAEANAAPFSKLNRCLNVQADLLIESWPAIRRALMAAKTIHPEADYSDFDELSEALAALDKS